MPVTKLLHTRYRLNDLERSVRFYREVLGLEEVRRHKSPRGSELVFLKAPQSEETIELCHFPSSGPVQVQPDLTHLAFEVESLEEFDGDGGTVIGRRKHWHVFHVVARKGADPRSP